MTAPRLRLFHGGVPGLRPGDLIEPGHQRKTHDGCAWCAARADIAPTLDGLPLHEDRVYLTPERSYARYYASLYGRGDLYQVEALGHLQRSTADTLAHAGDRAVLLTMSERRRLYRAWGEADAEALAAHAAHP